MSKMSEAGGGREQAAVNEASVINAIVMILRESKGAATVAATVMALYKEDPRFKDFVRNKLGSTVIDILERHPAHFALDEGKNLVALSTDENSEHVFSMTEVARHNHKEDAWIVVNGEVYNITDFVRTHWGWNSAGKNSTIIAIMSSLGGDCTIDFEEVSNLARQKFTVAQISKTLAFRISSVVWLQLRGSRNVESVVQKKPPRMLRFYN